MQGAAAAGAARPAAPAQAPAGAALSKAEQLLGVSGSMNVFGGAKQSVDESEFGGDAMAEAQRANAADAVCPAAPSNEDDLIKSMVSQSAMGWRQEVRDANTSRRGGFGFGRGGSMGRGRIGGDVPPPGYICNRCRQPGHFIANCPTNGDPAFEPKKVRAPLGLPLSQLYKVQGQDAPGAAQLVTTTGEVALLKPNEDIFAKEIALVPTGGQAGQSEAVPPELECSLCKKVMTDAMLIPCCQRSFCNDCIRCVGGPRARPPIGFPIHGGRRARPAAPPPADSRTRPAPPMVAAGTR